MQCCPAHRQHAERHPAAPSEVHPAWPWPPHPHSPHHGTGGRGDTRAPLHQACCATWPGTKQQSIETDFHGKIRSIFCFWVADCTSSNSDATAHLPKHSGRQSSGGAAPLPEGTLGAWGHSTTAAPAEQGASKGRTKHRKKPKITGSGDSQRDQINNKMFPGSTAPALTPPGLAQG